MRRFKYPAKTCFVPRPFYNCTCMYIIRLKRKVKLQQHVCGVKDMSQSDNNIYVVVNGRGGTTFDLDNKKKHTTCLQTQ